MSSDWIWISEQGIHAAHREQLAEHGGGDGVRDHGLLQSALARPLNLLSYGDPDAADLAAAYAFGIARNHPFVDGNKRTALVAAETFLNLNGYDLSAGNAELVVVFLDLAAGQLGERELAAWLREKVAKRG